ncbi:hypothetical protein VTN02DRAFT_2643 [Thermoascus thermophilus]
MNRYLQLSPSSFASFARPSKQISALLRTAVPGGPRAIENVSRAYATQGSLGREGSASGPTRKQITVMSDDGRLRWSELTGKEKVARATQQSFNFMIVVIGAVMTGGVFTFLYLDVFSPDSKTWQFNKAVDRIREDPRCTALLGDGNEIRAYGETTWNKWARNRPVATTIEKDRLGRDHLKMHFHVSGPLNEGTVSVHMIKPSSDHEFEYQLLALDVKGHPRVVLEHAPESGKGGPLKIFGIQWR